MAEVLRDQLPDGRTVLLLPEVRQGLVADLLATCATSVAARGVRRAPAPGVLELLAVWWLGGVNLDRWEQWATCTPERAPVPLPEDQAERVAVFHAERHANGRSGYRLAGACCAACPVAPECLSGELEALPSTSHGFRAGLQARARSQVLTAARQLVDGTRTADVPDQACTGQLRLRTFTRDALTPGVWGGVRTPADVDAEAQRRERAAAAALEYVPVAWLLEAVA